MIEYDKADFVQLIQHQRSEAAAYWRQWMLWLSVGSAGAAIALISLAAKLPDPNYAFRLFLPSLWSFLVGVIAAAISLPIAALRADKTGEHFAAAHNREQGRNAAQRIPEVVSSPRSIAAQMNTPRTELLKNAEKAHAEAEMAWSRRRILHGMVVVLLSISALSFVFGVSWPLFHMSRGGSLTPPGMASPPSRAGAAN